MANDKYVPSDRPESREDFAKTIAGAVADAVSRATVQVHERIAPVESRKPSLKSPYNPEGLEKRPRLAWVPPSTWGW